MGRDGDGWSCVFENGSGIGMDRMRRRLGDSRFGGKGEGDASGNRAGLKWLNTNSREIEREDSELAQWKWNAHQDFYSKILLIWLGLFVLFKNLHLLVLV